MHRAFKHSSILIRFLLTIIEANVKGLHEATSDSKPFAVINLVPVDAKSIDPERLVSAEAVEYYISKVNEKCNIFSHRRYEIPIKDQSPELTDIALDIV